MIQRPGYLSTGTIICMLMHNTLLGQTLNFDDCEPEQVFPFSFQIRTPFNYLLMNLIIAESLITMYGLPVDFTATYHFGWKMGENLCKATGFILTTSGKIGILLLELF